MKRWKDLEAGDCIYYYDHCKMHEQVIHSVEIKEIEKVEVDRYNPRRKTIGTSEKMILTIGPRHIEFEVPDYALRENFDNYWYDFNHWGIHRFSCKEAAEEYLKNLVDKRLKKANYLKEKLDQTLGILAKYETLNPDF